LDGTSDYVASTISPSSDLNATTNRSVLEPDYRLPPTWALALCAGIPLWWRLLHNCRLLYMNPRDKLALGDAVKFLLGLSLVVLSSFGTISSSVTTGEDSALFWAYIACFTVNTLYVWAWDVFVDWGLLTCSKPRSSGTPEHPESEKENDSAEAEHQLMEVELSTKPTALHAQMRNDKSPRRAKAGIHAQNGPRVDMLQNLVDVADEERASSADAEMSIPEDHTTPPPRMISRHHESADMSHDELLEQLGDNKNAALVCGYSVKLRPMRGFALPVYITAVILDFFLRAMWTFDLSPQTSPLTFLLYLAPVLGVLEVCRRSMWAIFRVENEHMREAIAEDWSMSPMFFVQVQAAPLRLPLWRRVLPSLIFAMVLVVVVVLGVFL